MRRVDVHDTRGNRIYINMIDDPKLGYLHWGDSYGFLDRWTIKRNCWQIVSRKKDRKKNITPLTLNAASINLEL